MGEGLIGKLLSSPEIEGERLCARDLDVIESTKRFLNFKWLLEEKCLLTQTIKRLGELEIEEKKIYEQIKELQSAQIVLPIAKDEVSKRHQTIEEAKIKNLDQEENRKAIKAERNKLEADFIELKSAQIEDAKHEKMLLQAKILEFEKLLFEFLAAPDEDSITAKQAEIIELINENPELEYQSLHVLCTEAIQENEINREHLEDQVLSRFPKMLQRYYEIKRENNQAPENDGHEEAIDIENLYKIKTDMLDAYIYVHPNLSQELEKLSQDKGKLTKDVLIRKLREGIPFIGAGSEKEGGMSGIKSYNGMKKIRIYTYDEEVLITEIYKTQSGSLVFVAGKLITHGILGRKNKVTQLQTIFHKEPGKAIADIVKHINELSKKY